MYWTLSVVLLLVIAGGFWYVSANFSRPEKAEQYELAAVLDDTSDEIEIVLVGEVPEVAEDAVAVTEEKVEGKVEETAGTVSTSHKVIDTEIKTTDAEDTENAEDEDEVEVIFECETGDDLVD